MFWKKLLVWCVAYWIQNNLLLFLWKNELNEQSKPTNNSQFKSTLKHKCVGAKRLCGTWCLWRCSMYCMTADEAINQLHGYSCCVNYQAPNANDTTITYTLTTNIKTGTISHIRDVFVSPKFPFIFGITDWLQLLHTSKRVITKTTHFHA